MQSVQADLFKRMMDGNISESGARKRVVLTCAKSPDG